MKTTLFYFTGTGNSLKVARDLAETLGDTEIVDISEVIYADLEPSYERIGLVYPVYMFGMPLIVRRFVRKLTHVKMKYIFAVVNCGGMAAYTLKENQALLRSIGIKLSAGFFVFMPENYIPLFKVPGAEEQKRMFAKTGDKIKDIAAFVSENRKGVIEKGSFLTNLIFSHIIGRASSPYIPKSDKYFLLGRGCNGCGLCYKICPVNNIKMEEGKPVWRGKCEQCLRCMHLCPQVAIQFGKMTLKKARYRNPDVPVADLVMR